MFVDTEEVLGHLRRTQSECVVVWHEPPKEVEPVDLRSFPWSLDQVTRIRNYVYGKV